MNDILQKIANLICMYTPSGFIISLRIEEGSAWVELEGPNGSISLPGLADKNLMDQLNDALCIANGFSV